MIYQKPFFSLKAWAFAFWYFLIIRNLISKTKLWWLALSMMENMGKLTIFAHKLPIFNYRVNMKKAICWITLYVYSQIIVIWVMQNLCHHKMLCCVNFFWKEHNLTTMNGGLLVTFQRKWIEKNIQAYKFMNRGTQLCFFYYLTTLLYIISPLCKTL